MIISKSKKMMRRSFEKTLYRFTEIPESRFEGNFGVYIHVPFCYAKCSFCPFYKEIFSEELKDRYLDAILTEIDNTSMHGRAEWVYLGGGTPNTLTIEEISSIVDRLKHKIQVNNIGIELLPTRLTEKYLRGLKACGFTKISVGVESFSDKVLNNTGREIAEHGPTKEYIEFAKSLGLWVNVDMMVGLPDQDPKTFIKDMEMTAGILPNQVTIYPFMVIRGVNASPSISSNEQFRLIERANDILSEYGYDRKSVWTFALGDDIYDSSRDELVEDYAGFGPAAFSTCGYWKVVNPELDVYIKSFESDKRMGFVAPRAKASEGWRRFARMIYDLKCDSANGFPFYIKIFIWVLKLTRYGKRGTLTEKGRIFAHEVTKTVVESLPFPVQNHEFVENYDEYLAYKMSAVEQPQNTRK
jgi:coproporphyrinogen III oxidase-like Fe-S oxidoreductase